MGKAARITGKDSIIGDWELRERRGIVEVTAITGEERVVGHIRD